MIIPADRPLRHVVSRLARGREETNLEKQYDGLEIVGAIGAGPFQFHSAEGTETCSKSREE